MNNKTYNLGQEVIAACQLLDVNHEKVLGRLGFPIKPANQSSLYLTPEEISRIFEIIVTEYGKDDFHIRLAEGFAKAPFGNAFLALQCSENLHNGIYRVARFKELIEPVKWEISENAFFLNINLKSTSVDYKLFGTAQIMTFLWLVKCTRNVSLKPVNPVFIMVTDTFAYRNEIEQEMGCEILIGDQACVKFRIADLAHPVLSINRFVISGLEAGVSRSPCQNSHNNNNNNYSKISYKIILELLPSGEVTSERVAKRLALSKRTFERRLSGEGITFKEILLECRQEMARHYLQDTFLPINEVGLLLGFREANSFFRAFRGWYNCSPMEMRTNSRKKIMGSL